MILLEFLLLDKIYLTIIVPIFICSINYFVGIKILNRIIKQDFIILTKKFAIFATIRTLILLAIIFLFVKMELVEIISFLVLFFCLYFVFKIIEVIKISKFIPVKKQTAKKQN